MMTKYIFFFFILFGKISSKSTLSSKDPLELSSKQSLVSPGNVFELGLFKPDASSSRVGDRWYLGIWRRSFRDKVVWVANRDIPLSKPKGTLKIFNSNLLLLDQNGRQVWSTPNGTKRNPKSLLIGELRDNGNFVLRYSNKKDSNGFLWQSFDFPTDSLVANMKFGWDRKSGLARGLTSWKTAYDPSKGNYTYTLEKGVLPQSYIRKNGLPTLRIGPWAPGRHDIYNVTMTKEETSFYFTNTSGSFFSIIRLTDFGFLHQYIWFSKGHKGKVPQMYSLPADRCDEYNKCGPNGLCDINTSMYCICIKGFEAIDQSAWNVGNTKMGCKRKTPLSCSRDKFLQLKTMKLPDTRESIVDLKIGLKECKDKCLKNCKCTAYANMIGGSGCVIWVGGLMDLRITKIPGQDLFVRLAASDVDMTKTKP